MTEKKLPTFDELPSFKDLPGCAWEVWGKGDELGTINLLTDDVVQRAAKEEIRTGRSVSLNWPINFPRKPMFSRKTPEHKILPFVLPGIEPGQLPVHDEELHMNTQSGSQWDGLRHFGIISENVFYQGVRNDEIVKGEIVLEDPMNVDPALVKLGIHNWAQHGICGRGVLVDLVKYFTKSDTKDLPYDPWTQHPITVDDIKAAAQEQGVQFRRGDILLLRMGFMRKFNASTQEARDALRGKEETFAGIKQGLEMKRFLWDNHFAAVASDMPSLEQWPIPEGEQHMHQTILGLWGMPIGEFFDLERLAKACHDTERYQFFFSSWPLNILGGCASPPNAAAYF